MTTWPKVGFLTIVPPVIVPSANSVSGAGGVAPSRSATWSALPAGGSWKELCVGQQLMSSLVPMPLVESWKPSAWPSGVRRNGDVTDFPPSGTGMNE